MFGKEVVPSRAVRLYTWAGAGVAAPIAAASSRTIRDRGPTPSMPPLQGNSDTEIELPEVSRASRALHRSGPGWSLTGGPFSAQPAGQGFRTPRQRTSQARVLIDPRSPIDYGG